MCGSEEVEREVDIGPQEARPAECGDRESSASDGGGTRRCTFHSANDGGIFVISVRRSPTIRGEVLRGPRTWRRRGLRARSAGRGVLQSRAAVRVAVSALLDERTAGVAIAGLRASSNRASSARRRARCPCQARSTSPSASKKPPSSDVFAVRDDLREELADLQVSAVEDVGVRSIVSGPRGR